MLFCKLIGAFYFCNFLIAEMIAALHFLQSYDMITFANCKCKLDTCTVEIN